MSKLGTSEYRETAGLFFDGTTGINCWVVYNLELGKSLSADFFCKTEEDAQALVDLENNPVWAESVDEEASLVLVLDIAKVVYDDNKLASVRVG